MCLLMMMMGRCVFRCEADDDGQMCTDVKLMHEFTDDDDDDGQMCTDVYIRTVSQQTGLSMAAGEASRDRS